jgi:quercetin dioxygenase-like cupin family protein
MSEQRPPDMAPGVAGSPYLATYAGKGDSALLDGERTRGRLSVVVRELVAGAAVPYRRHAAEDISYLVLEGEVALEVPGRTWAAGSMTLLHVPPTVAHRYRAVTNARLLVLAVPAGVEQFLLHEDRLAEQDPGLLLALAQEHHIEVIPGLPL